MLRFPRTKFVDSSPLCEIVRKLYEECLEVGQELQTPLDVQKMAVEAFDVIQVCETMLYRLQERHGVNLEAAAVEVVRKNSERGYYE